MSFWVAVRYCLSALRGGTSRRGELAGKAELSSEQQRLRRQLTTSLGLFLRGQPFTLIVGASQRSTDDTAPGLVLLTRYTG